MEEKEKPESGEKDRDEKKDRDRGRDDRGRDRDRSRRRERRRHPEVKRERSPSLKQLGSTQKRAFSLKKTSGVTAAGAWNARFEIADLLEAGIDRGELISIIRAGKEGEGDIHGGEESASSVRPAAEPPREPPVSLPLTPAKESDSGLEDWETIRSKQQSILDSLGKDDETLPPWASKKGSLFKPSDTSSGSGAHKPASPPQSPEPPKSLFGETKGSGVTFVKRAKPPPESSNLVQVVETKMRSPDFESLLKDDEGEMMPRFLKPARPPPFEYSPERESFGEPGKKPPRKTDPPMTEREKTDMERYFNDTYAVYSFFKEKKIAMDLVSIVESAGGTVDDVKFRMLTIPNRSSTGLGYSRMMKRFMKWRAGRCDLDGTKGSPDQVAGVLDFIIHLTQHDRAFLYAWEYFAKAFGYEAEGPHWGRARRLCSQYAQSRESGTSKAPAFRKATLVALETPR